MALLELDHVSKVYRMGDDVQVRALDDVTVRVEEGEFLVVMGSSGSGKSTLMNIVGCLDRPTRGRYLLASRDVSQLSRAALAQIRNFTLGFVFQSFNLLSRTSALENVELPLLYAGVATRERHRRAAAALARFGLDDRLDHHPSQLSGGQQQRVAIARALVTRPRVILADEPTGNLDSRSSAEIMGVFQQLVREGITLVMVTHEPENADFASRVLTMKDGRLLSDRQGPQLRPTAPATTNPTGGANGAPRPQAVHA